MYAHIRSDGVTHSLNSHLEGTALLAEKLGKKIGINNIMFLTGLLHDIGKASSIFQEYLYKAFNDQKSVRRGEVNHSSAGGKYIFDDYYKNDKIQKLTALLISTAIFSHHGQFDIISPNGENIFNNRLFPKKEIEYKEVIKYAEKLRKEFNLEEYFNNAYKECSNIFSKTYEISRLMDNRKDTAFFLLSCFQRIILSILIDADYTDTNMFMNENSQEKSNDYESWSDLEKKVIKKISQLDINSPINVLRKELSDTCYKFSECSTGIYCLPIPTGGGKTITSLRYAISHAKKFSKSRIIYVAPYLSILEQNANVYRNILDNDDLILEHHSNVILSDYESDELYRYLIDTWDRPIILTTMVQFLNVLFSGNMQNIRRMHQLANSIIIFDEIQSLPINIISMFNSMMNFLCKICNTTIILSSATQPLLGDVERKILYSEPVNMIKNVGLISSKFKRTDIIPITEKFNIEKMSNFISEKIEEVDSLLVILNTKKTVRQLYERIKSYITNVNIYQLTTFMCAEHRKDILGEIKKYLGRKKIICISTQLIEAGVDISFHCVIRSLAGLDSIAQAAGRCNRNGEIDGFGKVFVINYLEEDLSKLLDIKNAQNQAEKVIYNYLQNPAMYDNDLISPKAIEAFYKFYFFDRKNEMDYQVNKYMSLYDLLSLNTQGKKAYEDIIGTSPDINLIQAYKTAGEYFEVIGSKTIGLLVPYKEGKAYIEKIKKSNDLKEIKDNLRRMQRYTVNLYQNSQIIQDLISRHAIDNSVLDGSILILHDSFYNDEYGVTDELTVDII